MLTSDASTTFAVIDGATGAILRTGTAEIDHLSALFDHDGQDLIAPVPAGVSDDTHYWTGEDFAVYPPRPGDWAVWTGAEWIDPRTPEDLVSEAAARLTAARRAALMDKTNLLLALSSPEVGILSVEEAIVAAQGQIPPSFQTAFDALPQEAQGVARIKWAGDTVISRTNPLIMLAAYAAGIGDEVLDMVFGVEVPA